MSLVIDSSITLAWFFKDERTPAVLAVFSDVQDAGAVVPILWRYEVANALQMAVRRRRITTADRDETLADLTEIDVMLDPEGNEYAWSSSLRLSDRHRLTVYDAAYLELAQRRRLPLATLDRALIRAGEAEGVKVIGHE